jgi:exodeoxyribonuclease VII small subunit
MSESKQYDFEAKLKELEEITAWLESDEVNLDQALAKFERGMALSAELKQQLKHIENRVEKIKHQYGQTDDQAN